MPCPSRDGVEAFMKRKSVELVRGFNVKNCLSELYSKDVLSYENLDDLTSSRRAGKSNREMTEDLLAMLQVASQEKKLTFLWCVHEKQPHLVTGDELAKIDQHPTPPRDSRDEKTIMTPERNPSDTPPRPTAVCLQESLQRHNAEDKPITRRHILDLSKKSASRWKKIVRRLPLAGDDDELAFSEEDLKKLEKEEDDDEDRFIVAMSEWRLKNNFPTWSVLINVYRSIELTAVAEEVFKKHVTS